MWAVRAIKILSRTKPFRYALISLGLLLAYGLPYLLLLINDKWWWIIAAIQGGITLVVTIGNAIVLSVRECNAEMEDERSCHARLHTPTCRACLNLGLAAIPFVAIGLFYGITAAIWHDSEYLGTIFWYESLGLGVTIGTVLIIIILIGLIQYCHREYLAEKAKYDVV
jgi:hypothetical protein